jgi:hypothetical protein
MFLSRKENAMEWYHWAVAVVLVVLGAVSVYAKPGTRTKTSAGILFWTIAFGSVLTALCMNLFSLPCPEKKHTRAEIARVCYFIASWSAS